MYNVSVMFADVKNISIIGGLLIVIANKPQICSVDYYLDSKRR